MRRVGAGLVLLITLALCGSAQAGDRVFWTVGSTVQVADLDGTGTAAAFNTAGTSFSGALGITIDPKRRWLVFADLSNDTISYARLDGGGGGSLGDGTPGAAGSLYNGATGVAVDSANDQFFVTNQSGTTLDRAPFDPNQGGSVFSSDGTRSGTYGAVMDPSTQTLWWTSYSHDTISHAHVPDGSGGDLTTTGVTVHDPRGLALDKAAGHVLWADRIDNKISFANLDGSGGGGDLNVGSAPIGGPRGIAIDTVTRRIYWINDTGSVAWASLDGGTGGKLFDTAMQARFLVIQRVPRNTGIPAVSGGSESGALLSCSDGHWLADAPEALMFAAPTGFAYQWTLNGNDIPGATGSSFTAAQPGAYRCRVTASNEAGSAAVVSDPHTVAAPPAAPGGSNGPPPAQLTAPLLSSLKRTNSVFAVAKGATPLTGRTASKTKQGTVFAFALDKDATVTVLIRRKPPHRRSVKAGTLVRIAHAGLNKLAFSGRIRRKALKPGSYTATFTASNNAGASAPKTVGFKIVKR